MVCYKRIGQGEEIYVAVNMSAERVPFRETLNRLLGNYEELCEEASEEPSGRPGEESNASVRTRRSQSLQSAFDGGIVSDRPEKAGEADTGRILRPFEAVVWMAMRQ